VDRALEALKTQPDIAPEPLSADTPNGQLAASYLLAILEGDRKRATDCIFEAARKGRSVEELYVEVLGPAQVEIGRLWHANELTVAEEHFATATTGMTVAQLATFATYKPRNGKAMVGAAPEGNYHDLGLQIVTNLFEFDGWRTVYLGGNVPVEDMARAVAMFKADLLVLSVTLSLNVPTTREIIAALKQDEQTTACKVLVGGPAFAGSRELALAIGADDFAETAMYAVAAGNRLAGLGAS
jgi:methanogenic corrinoid protein MtbC1